MTVGLAELDPGHKAAFTGRKEQGPRFPNHVPHILPGNGHYVPERSAAPAGRDA